ncbi:zinc metalloproteinase nas-36-like isoform X2 [Biomphalaria glabrata]|uniref:Metalloendopeptidase n=1 Tax=Biomphalaria glabrata TaxID=6526 RepID=A0A9W2ZAV4_BIOGL|nr:zinc metalloproteinase nas-36-like isoform X2 [Biomphalaria glabrata]
MWEIHGHCGLAMKFSALKENLFAITYCSIFVCISFTWAAPATGVETATQIEQSQNDLKEVSLIIQKLEQEMVRGYNTSRTTDKLPSEVLFEGDIRLTAKEAEMILTSSRSRKKRKMTSEEDKKWALPIPYRFNDSHKYFLNATEKAVILSAMKELTDLTCITFQEVGLDYPNKPILDFRKDEGCWSYVGREKAFQLQEISTAKGCFEKGILLHELGHAIGFWHEQSRPDRDDYVTYIEDNVKRGEEFNFKRENWGDMDNMGVPYDVGSIMHYGSTFFSQNGRPTLESRDPLLQRDLGQREAMSFFDVKLANLAYCKDSCPAATMPCLHDGYPDPKDCGRCRCPDGLSGTVCQSPASSVGANCGGPLFIDSGVRYTVRSPGYPWAYVGSTQCNWHFQTRPGMRIHLEVKPDNFMRHLDCPVSNYSVCQDYLEIKYNLSFGYTGARFCCGLAPQTKIISSGNAMVLIFKTIRNGIGGFSAEIFAESCGGCFDVPYPQKPCHVAQATACRQEWYKMEFVPCPVYSPLTYVCNKYLPRKHSRASTCEVEVQRCCKGFSVKGGLCIADDRVETTKGQDIKEVDTTMFATTSESTEEPITGWTSWTQWTSCTATCGGCGRRTRSRACKSTPLCGGEQADSETQVCNTQPCPNYQAYACTSITKEEYNCGWLINCSRTKTEIKQCVTRCCPNYEDRNGICQPATSSRRKRKRRK